MQPLAIPKFRFRIRTRDGLIVDNLHINGQDEGDATRKLRQMYRQCEVLTCVCKTPVAAANTNFEDVVSLITR